MELKNKDLGFTIIDLLVIIFILVMLSILTLPPILTTIDNYQQKLILIKTNKLIKKVETDYTGDKMIYTYDNKKETSIKKLNYKNFRPQFGTIIIKNAERVAVTFYKMGYCVEKSFFNKEILMTKKNQKECVMPYIDDSGSDKPDLKEGMIPVIYQENEWVKADITDKWYDYENKEWANVVLVTEISRRMYQKAKPGTPIHEMNVLAHFVWIPRYKYKLFNVDSLPKNRSEIEINFETIYDDKSKGTSNGEWLTHPAFTFGEEELNGLWVGKFETTGTRSKPTIKPNFRALAYQNIGSQYNIAQSFNSEKMYGLKISSDTHMMKNIEWGAVAYLTNSKYGKNSEIWVNPSKDFITGCAGDSPSTGLLPDCPYSYETKQGQHASTTGNIYGIYDMSGGTAEYVMGGLYDKNNKDIKLSLATFDKINTHHMDKYIDKYRYGITSKNQDAYNRRTLGDATGETRGWYDDNSEFIVDDPNWNDYGNYWFIRGGYYNDKKMAGIFSFSSQDGAAYNYNGFRVVIPGIE